MRINQYLIRNANAPEFVELFLIASVASVLGIRLFLAAAGYPQLGGEGLHIAHMLWGGLFMTIALFLQFSLLGPTMQRFAAILAGIGFGTFIDELGKFITNDNNYFFQPTIALIYIIFIVIYLLSRNLPGKESFTPGESLANALYRMQEVVNGRVNEIHKGEVLDFLERAGSNFQLVQPLREYTAQIDTMHFSDLRFYFRWRDYTLNLYRRIVQNKWFTLAVVAVFVVAGVGQIIAVAAIIIENQLSVNPESLEFSFTEWAQTAASAAAGCFILIGIYRLRTSRASSYRWFLRAMLVNIFITQVFVFFEDQLAATVGLGTDILVYLALRFMIEGEESRILSRRESLPSD